MTDRKSTKTEVTYCVNIDKDSDEFAFLYLGKGKIDGFTIVFDEISRDPIPNLLPNEDVMEISEDQYNEGMEVLNKGYGMEEVAKLISKWTKSK